jgi:hypothetical protein
MTSITSTLVDLLGLRPGNHPNQPIYTALMDGETATISLTYGEFGSAGERGALLQRIETVDPPALLRDPRLRNTSSFAPMRSSRICNWQADHCRTTRRLCSGSAVSCAF